MTERERERERERETGMLYLDDAPVEAMAGAPEAADWLD